MKLKINIDGKQYEADIEVVEDEQSGAKRAAPARPQRQRSSMKAPPSAPESNAAPTAGDGKLCKSPILGIVVKVLVSVGQSVNKGETLLVLEAMKMESNVESPVTGTVKAILVSAGDSAKKGQPLIEFS